MRLRLHVEELQPLSEMAEKVNQSKILQEICHLLVLQVLEAADVRVQVLNGDVVPPQEAVESLLKIRKLVESRQGEVCYD